VLWTRQVFPTPSGIVYHYLLNYQLRIRAAPFPDFAWLRLHHRHCLPGVVHEQLLPALMTLPHGGIESVLPLSVVVAKLAVSVSVQLLLSVLQPQQAQGDPFTLQLLVHVLPVRLRDLPPGWPFMGIQTGFQLLRPHPFWKRPAQPCRFGVRDILTHRTARHPATFGNRLV